MTKVRLTEEAFNQLADHPYLTEDTIIGIVIDSTLERREYIDVVYGIHSVKLSKRKR